MIQALTVLAATLSLASCGQPPPPVATPPAPSTATGAAGATAKPPAPAFKPGMVVVDRTGARVGVVKTITETPGGLNVVIEIEGKLVGVLDSTLQLRGESAASSQTRAEILAMAGAPS
jgi:hypothetical protein